MDKGKTNIPDSSVKVLIFAGSLKNNSINKKLASLAAFIVERNGGIVDFADLSEFDCPSYNQDLEVDEFPQGAKALLGRLNANDAFMISSPEYNFSMPGVLKNIIDWVSRFRPQPFNEKHGLLMSASPSMAGGNRGLWSLRIPLEHLGGHIYPHMFSLALAHEAFSDNGSRLNNETLQIRFEENIIAFLNLVEAAKHYPCMKKHWVEFLGEKPENSIDRAE
ncbi:NADPH-dependent FMN reductase [Cytophagaceae bacterium ABcell3]|nr:NADPH-dependent FMN reductase [Cytophagaceae bacterium ABcell3]